MGQEIEGKQMNAITQALNACRPFMGLVAMLCGAIGAWALATEILPILGQIWKPRFTAQTILIGGACLAIIGGSR